VWIQVAQIGLKIIVLLQYRVKKVDDVEEEAAVAADKTYSGKCHCGAVTYRAVGLSDIWYCHCKQCQHLTGLYIAAAGVKRENLKIKGDVNWLPISERSNSGHCKQCGSYMFWDAHEFQTVSILAGSIDDTAGLEVKGHIYVAEKGDYYDITDGLPQFDANPQSRWRARSVSTWHVP